MDKDERLIDIEMDAEKLKQSLSDELLRETNNSSGQSSADKGNNPWKKVDTFKVSSPSNLQASPLDSDSLSHGAVSNQLGSGNTIPSLSDAVKQKTTKKELRNRHVTTPSPAGHESVTQRQDLSSPSDDGLGTLMEKPYLSSPSDGPETVTQKSDLPLSDGHETKMPKPDLWSPPDDGLPTFTQAQTDFLKSHNRILPDDVFENYKYTKRLPVFKQLAPGDSPPQTKP